VNLIVYHGVLAPNAKRRRKVVVSFLKTLFAREM